MNAEYLKDALESTINAVWFTLYERYDNYI